MTFNDEALARAVAACPVPVVTGIGHEPDTSICDMVSDRRSSTPTAAAESVAPAMGDLADVLDARERRLAQSFGAIVRGAAGEVDGFSQRIARAMGTRLSRLALALDGFASRPVLTRPTASLEQRAQEIDLTQERLLAAGGHTCQRLRADLERVAPGLSKGMESVLSARRHALALDGSRMVGAGKGLVDRPASALGAAAAKLDALSPLKVLARGYSIAYDGDAVATSIEDFAAGDAMRVRLADGDVYGTVGRVERAAAGDAGR